MGSAGHGEETLQWVDALREIASLEGLNRSKSGPPRMNMRLDAYEVVVPFLGAALS